MYEQYAGILRMLPLPVSVKTENIEYEAFPCSAELVETRMLDEVCGGGTDFEKAAALLRWLSDHVCHRGDYDNHVEMRAEPLLEYSFDRGVSGGINCLNLSFILCECLLALGIKARMVSIMPLSPYDCDNHVVCEVYAADLGKWVMLDPTFRLYLTDENSVPLDCTEIREKLARREELLFCEGWKHSHQPTTEADVMEYYAKDMAWFQVKKYQGRRYAGSPVFSIAPEALDLRLFSEENSRFRIGEYRKYGLLDEATISSLEERHLKNIPDPILCGTEILK